MPALTCFDVESPFITNAASYAKEVPSPVASSYIRSSALTISPYFRTTCLVSDISISSFTAFGRSFSNSFL